MLRFHSWAITRQWRVYCIASLIMSSSSRRRAVSAKILYPVCFCYRKKILFSLLFGDHGFNVLIKCNFCVAIKSAEKLTPELVKICVNMLYLKFLTMPLVCTLTLFLWNMQTKLPSKAAGMFSGTQDKCATCGKTAYPLEKVCYELRLF